MCVHGVVCHGRGGREMDQSGETNNTKKGRYLKKRSRDGNSNGERSLMNGEQCRVQARSLQCPHIFFTVTWMFFTVLTTGSDGEAALCLFPPPAGDFLRPPTFLLTFFFFAAAADAFLPPCFLLSVKNVRHLGVVRDGTAVTRRRVFSTGQHKVATKRLELLPGSEGFFPVLLPQHPKTKVQQGVYVQTTHNQPVPNGLKLHQGKKGRVTACLP